MYVGLSGTILMKATISYFTYYATDAGRDALELPFGMW